MKHINPELMKITLPADVTPAYFDTHHVIHVPTVQPGLVDGGNEWLVSGMRHHLEAFANKVATLHFTALDQRFVTARGVR